MGLSRGRVSGLIKRRGSLVSWFHALPVPDASLNQATLEPHIPLGSKRKAAGPFGESYLEPIIIRAYLSNKISQTFTGQTGLVEVGDYQLDLPLPFPYDPCSGIVQPPANVQAAYEKGDFFVAVRGGTPITDKFNVEGALYTAKAKPVPILDHNQTIAWRLLVKKAEY